MNTKALFYLIFASFILFSCGGENNSDENTDENTSEMEVIGESDMNEMNLSDQGLNMSFMLPEVASSTGASIEPTITHDDGDYFWFLDIGNHFHLVIEDYGKEKNKVAEKKKELEGLKDIFVIEYKIDEPNLIMYKRSLHEGQGGKATYHCYGETTIDGYTYVLHSSEDGGLKPVIDDMVTTIRSVKEVKPA
ncbi:MAG: hypothetical protein ACWA41_11370 [Putridiphycobacter sp.]